MCAVMLHLSHDCHDAEFLRARRAVRHGAVTRSGLAVRQSALVARRSGPVVGAFMLAVLRRVPFRARGITPAQVYRAQGLA